MAFMKDWVDLCYSSSSERRIGLGVSQDFGIQILLTTDTTKIS